MKRTLSRQLNVLEIVELSQMWLCVPGKNVVIDARAVQLVARCACWASVDHNVSYSVADTISHVKE